MKALYFKIYKVISSDRIFFSFYYLRIILILLLILNCSASSYENPCSPGSKIFQRIYQLKAIAGDGSSFCGISSSILSRNSSSSTTGLTLTSFSFTDSVNGLSKTYTGTITGNNIAIDVPYGKMTSAIPTIVTNATTIQAGTTTVVSGATALDFTNPKIFTLTSSNGSKLVYTVTAYSIAPVADTGQTICFNNGSVAACSATTASFPNQDGELQNFPNPKGTQAISTNPSYPNDQINVDTLKGLVWKTCHEGLSGSGCATGSGTTASQSTAATMCNTLNSTNAGNGYAGLKKWRLPNMQELIQLIEYNGNTSNYTYWNPTYFPNAPSAVGNYRWTSSVLGANALAVYDYVQSQAIGAANYVHCVNGDSQPAFDMVDSGDGTILDRRTKLIWQKCAYGQTNDAACTGALGLSNWTSSMLFCKNLTLGGKSWRMPNVNEMMTMIDVSRSSPFVDPALFPNIAGGDYDTTTTYQANLAYSQIFTINTPTTQGISGKGGPTYNLRCVAGP